MPGHRRVLGFPLQPPRLPGFARVGRVPSGRTVELPGRGCTYVVDSGPVPGAPTFMLANFRGGFQNRKIQTSEAAPQTSKGYPAV